MNNFNEQIVKNLKELNFTEYEAKLYLYILKIKEFNYKEVSSMNIPLENLSSILEKFLKNGLIIKGKNNKYKCLHPRMGLTNIYKIWENDILVQMRKKRAKVEFLVRQLSSLYENE